MTTETDLIAIAQQCGGTSLTFVAKPIEESVDGVALTPSQLVALKRAILADAAAGVEPVAWMHEDQNGMLMSGCSKDWADDYARLSGRAPEPLCRASTVAALQTRVAELEAQLLAAEVDAERYRWLHTEADRDYVEFGDRWYEFGPDLDAAVDEARSNP